MGNKLIFGDCLDVMLGCDDRGNPYIADGSVDLVYLDPPFNSKANYNMIFGKGRDKQAQMTAFTDTWQWGGAGTQDVADIEGAVGHPAHRAIKGIYYTLGECGLMAYLGYMARRLAVVHGKMKDTASIYLHCDPTASHYLKIVMDGIFSASNFQNELIWCYKGRELSKKRFNRKHDVILFYKKNKQPVFNWEEVGSELSEESRKAMSRHIDEKGRPFVLRYKKGGGFAPIDKDGDDSTYRQLVPDKVPPRDWLVLDYSRKSERMGYETQKPISLIRHFISASSNPGDIVFDPFCGCGTTIAAAEELNRRWIGIDISAATIRIVTKSRPELQMAKYEIHGIPKGMEEARRLAKMNRLQYEHWAISTIPGLAPNDRRNQEGFDGLGVFNSPIPDKPGKVEKQTVTAEVKSSKGGVTSAQRSHLKNHTSSNKSQLGIFLTLERDPATEKWCNQQGHYQLPGSATKYPRFQVFSAEQYFAGDHPNLPPLLDPMTGKPLQMPLPAP